MNIKIWAFPKEAGNFNDELICLIKDNPIPLIIAL